MRPSKPGMLSVAPRAGFGERRLGIAYLSFQPCRQLLHFECILHFHPCQPKAFDPPNLSLWNRFVTTLALGAILGYIADLRLDHASQVAD
jgi:hypothetical protein